MFDETSTSEWAITWKNLSVFVKIKNRNFFGKNPLPYKRLINNVSGAIRNGSLVVLMGPSGAGKSTLMGALAHRNASDVFVDGEVRVNGSPIGRFAHQITGFMHQEDLFVGTLTVKEHLHFMAKLKLGGIKSEKELKEIVDSLIIEMGLINCINTRITGRTQQKVISGGERKRLAFATEILTDPPILFCDEPTTGLDSFSARHLVTLMKQMVSRGKTVLCTIHQPSSELFSMFQQLILLADGRIAFIGDTESALEFFEKNGYPCPPHCNPAEIIIKALSTSQKNVSAVSRLCNEYSVSETARAFDELTVEETESKQDGMKYKNLRRRSPSWITTLHWLTYRSFLQVLRDPSIQITRILQKLGIALMAGLCFFGSIDLTQAGVQSVQGAIFILVTENTFPPMYGVLSLFPDEFPLFIREYKSNLYSPTLYYLSKMISFLPGLISESFLFVLVAYCISGLKRTVYAFFMSTMIAILTTNVASACGCFFSSAFGSVSMALAFLVPIDYTLMVTSGLFMKLSSIPSTMRWFKYLSWFMYSNEVLSIIQWESVHNLTCEFKNPEIPCLKSGEEVLKKFDFSPSHLTGNIFAMMVLYCCFHILAYTFLCWKELKISVHCKMGKIESKEKIPWVNDVEKAVLIAGLTRKPVFLLILKSLCPTCKALEPQYVQDKDFQVLSKFFVMARSMDQKKVEEKYAVDGHYVPRILFLDSKGAPMEKFCNESAPKTENKYFYSQANEVVNTMRNVLYYFYSLNRNEN